ncbi:hypothetical protein RchiOBHm_Chr2g0113201 [Rosa chinensis]|uniref:Uncharacterized protein n=1 Tax=Rosa chinensis TaxID=74649 RepID=A0A2P6RQD7_ROSCH|nr:hypothetical protein RchiOBHm_Chr2g0113201 [Rosa chinensis]
MDKKEREKPKKASDYLSLLKDSFTCGICNWLIRGRILLDRLDLDDPIEKKDKASLSEQLKSMPKISVDCVVSNHDCICHRVGCWQCMPLDVLKSRSVQELVDLKYQFFCRRLACLFLSFVNILNLFFTFSGNHAKVSETADIFGRSLHFLFNRAYTSNGDWTIYNSLLTRQVQGTALAVEQAELLYYATFMRIIPVMLLIEKET